MKNNLILGTIFCLFSTAMIMACSPVRTPYNELLENFNAKTSIIVEGYFQPNSKNKNIVFFVTKSSDPTIKVKKEYKVFEYGPFGSSCEMYEMQANIDSKIIGKDNTRLLILYKKRSINGKLVTPIFWEEGADASNNRIKSVEYNRDNGQEFLNVCETYLNEIWKKITNKNTKGLLWQKGDS